MSNRDAFTAIADPTRRRILDLLQRCGPLMAGEIASNFGDASRPGISRHLRVLKECGVVSSCREGKAQNYTLEANPLSALRDGWLAKFSEQQMTSLKSLRARVEARDRKISDT